MFIPQGPSRIGSGFPAGEPPLPSFEKKVVLVRARAGQGRRPGASMFSS